MTRWIFILLVLPILLGCSDKDKKVNTLKNTAVVVLCKAVEDNNRISYVVIEVWRDQSQGEFKHKIGSTLPKVVNKEDNTVYGKQVIILYSKSQTNIEGEFDSQMYSVYEQRVPGWDNKTVDDIRQLVRTVPYECNTSSR